MLYGEQDQRFDEIVGALETVMMDEDFRGPCEEFCRKHCGTDFLCSQSRLLLLLLTHSRHACIHTDVFESSDENKLEYTTLFTQYTELTGA